MTAGDRFGRLVAVESVRRNGKRCWKCKCDCGRFSIVAQGDLQRGKVKSCGCLRRESVSKMFTKHGGCGTRLYNIWQHMIARCENKRNPKFRCYGGRGIRVCDDWHSFPVFQKWALENGYEDCLTIERKDVNGNYEPENCSFIPLSCQAKNKTTSVLYTINGITVCEADAAKIVAVKASTLARRRRSGMSMDEAIKTPCQRTKAVEQLDLDGNLIKVWPSIKEAAQGLEINPPSIWKCCNGEIKKTHGFAWRYATKGEENHEEQVH